MADQPSDAASAAQAVAMSCWEARTRRAAWAKSRREPKHVGLQATADNG